MKQAVKSLAVASLVVVMAGSIVGCNRAPGGDGKANTQNYRANQNSTNRVATPDGVRTRSDGAGTARYNTIGVRPHAARNNEQRVADHMARLATGVKGVSRASAVVNGKDVIIGIDGANAADAKVKEREVYQALRKSQPGYNIHVTSDRNLHQRIRTLNTQMAAGHPVRDLTADIGALIRDIGRTVTAPFR
ncbi:YhcN/YlaJ family sporulation lipoprotein [Aneurinibacillus tyrosinisolvens]|uniref:YhcN/YlaJ family sporulation lipoprotein n=1 Tax=Aneurinibacillus tyrosinisolvens TaxID=1443435 RepID=UPI00063F6782|nr:YhcN/YlaJ family sporulation lipoprotein [Aneurinibacillus tyrosinisolvens]